jgi:hypothetical protein
MPFKYDYYKVDIPDDITDPRERARLAMMDARQRARLWVIPAIWTVIKDDGAEIIVRRTRPIVKQ